MGELHTHGLLISILMSIRFLASSVPFGPINNIKETFEHPQAVARGAVVEVDVSFYLEHFNFTHVLSVDPP